MCIQAGRPYPQISWTAYLGSFECEEEYCYLFEMDGSKLANDREVEELLRTLWLKMMTLSKLDVYTSLRWFFRKRADNSRVAFLLVLVRTLGLFSRMMTVPFMETKSLSLIVKLPLSYPTQ